VGDDAVRILQLHNRQLSSGGAELQVDREAEQLRALGHPVEQIIVDNREIEALGSVRAGLRAIWNQNAVTRVRDAAASFRPDLVHVHTPFPLMSPAVFRAASSLGLPIVATVRSFRYSCVRGTLARDGAICEACVGRRIKAPAVRHRCYHESILGSAALAGSLSLHRTVGTFGKIDRVLALSPFMREQLIAEGFDPARVSVKPNATPDPGPPLARREHYAVFAGRLAPEKGVQTLLHAWSELESDIGLVIVGDGELRPAVERAAARDGRIEFRGWMDHRATIEVMRASQLAIVPSEWYEAFGNVVLEAMATSTPVLVSDRTNNTAVVEPGVTGEVYEAGNPGALAKNVALMLSNPRLADLGVAGRRRYLATYTPEIVLDQLLGFYEEAVGTNRARRPS
jgi:glycosyltransferase involved in cell wall biosynthesis